MTEQKNKKQEARQRKAMDTLLGMAAGRSTGELKIYFNEGSIVSITKTRDIV